MLMRELGAGDRDAVGAMLVACGAFSGEEVAAALEIFDDCCTRADMSVGSARMSARATLFGAECEGQLAGYVCVAPVELTRSTWHVYWVCVDPSWQRRGVGRALLACAEEYIKGSGGERLVLETSGRADYAGARALYERVGYRVVGRIADYYKTGDDCVYYCKVVV